MDPRRSDGTVLVVVLLATLLVSAIAAAVVASSSAEVLVAANFRHALAALHAADAAAERAIADLASLADWDQVLNGSLQSTFTVGGTTEAHLLPDGTTLDLQQVRNRANCLHAAACSGAEMDAASSDRPWARNNPRWQLFAFGPLTALHPPGTVALPYFVVVLVGDDPSENDEDPLRDGGGANAAGAGLLALRAEAFGPRGTHRIVEVVVQRSGSGRLRVVSWRAV